MTTPLPPYTYKVIDVRVIDGDSVVATIVRKWWHRSDVDLGFHDRVERRRLLSVKHVRLLGIDAPELPTVDGVAAKTFLTGLLELPGLLVTTKLDASDKYGRVLGTFHHGDWGPTVNQQMIDAGHAVPYSGGRRTTDQER